jgi:hypothetical protein
MWEPSQGTILRDHSSFEEGMCEPEADMQIPRGSHDE